jgi:hypothetical protein
MGDPKVGQLWRVLLVEEDVVRLEVSVQNALRMHVFQPAGQCAYHFSCSTRRKRTGFQPTRQVATKGRVHDEVRAPKGHSGTVDPDHVWVPINASLSLSLAVKALQELTVYALIENLDRDRGPGSEVSG